MPYNSWPTGVLPYIADTHIIDRVSPVTHSSIMDGLAKDISNIQYNINTTHLFASGWLNPISSGWIQNIRTNNLYVNVLNTDIFTIERIDKERISNIEFSQTPSDFNLYDCAIIGLTIPIQNGFYSSNIQLDESGFVFNGTFASGNIYKSALVSGDMSYLRSLQSNGTVDFEDSIIVNGSGGVMLGDNAGLSGSINESDITWNPYGGHNHKNNRIIASDVQDGNIVYTTDIDFKPVQGDITLESGTLFPSNINVYLSDNDTMDFIKVPGTESMNASGIGLGLNKMLEFNGELFASPSGISSGIYKTRDLIQWDELFFTDVNSNGLLIDMAIHSNDIWFGFNNVDGITIKPLLYKDVVGDKIYEDDYKLHGMTEINGVLFYYGSITNDNYGSSQGWDRIFLWQNGDSYTENYNVDNVALIRTNETKGFIKSTDINGTIFETMNYNKYANMTSIEQFIEKSKYTGGDYIIADDIVGEFETYGFSEITDIIQIKGKFSGKNEIYNTGFNSTTSSYTSQSIKQTNDNSDSLLVLGNTYNKFANSNESVYTWGGTEPIYINYPFFQNPDNIEFGNPYQGTETIFGNYITIKGVAIQFMDKAVTSPGLSGYLPHPSGMWWHAVKKNMFEIAQTCIPGGHSGSIKYQHEDEIPTTIDLTSSSFSPSGISSSDSNAIPFSYFDRPKELGGFWKTKTMDWYYDNTNITHSGGAPEVPTSGLIPSHYHMETTSSLSHNGDVYSILKDFSGFVIIDQGGSTHIDDGVTYTDMIKFQGDIFAVGYSYNEDDSSVSYDFKFTIRKIIGRNSHELNISDYSSSEKTDNRFVIYNNKLYVGLGDDTFLVKRATHKEISTNKRV